LWLLLVKLCFGCASRKMEQRNLEQRCAIKFCVKLGESASVTFEELKQAYGEHSLSQTQVFRWHKSFLEGREHVEDEHRSGRLSTSKTDENIERVNTLVRSDCRLTVRMLSEELN
jgi:HTH domain in Mos1 transposase